MRRALALGLVLASARSSSARSSSARLSLPTKEGLVSVLASYSDAGYGDDEGAVGGGPSGSPPLTQYSYAAYQRGTQPQVNPHLANQKPPVVNPLLKQAGTASIGALFALLIWRSLSAYELADQFASGSFRLLAVTPTIVILCANLAGFVVNLFKPVNFKNHLKFILVVNICREAIELAFNFLKVLLTSSQSSIPREVYFGRFMMSTWWLFLCMTFSKSRWVSNVVLPKSFSYTRNHV